MTDYILSFSDSSSSPGFSKFYSNRLLHVIFSVLALLTTGEVVTQVLISDPGIVLPEKDGSLRLVAEKGKGIGPGIKYMPEWKAFGWFTAKDQVEWLVKAKKGNYEVYMEWSVSDKEAGKPFLLHVGDQLVKGTVATTGSWEEFKIVKIGNVRLRSGQHKIVFKPASDFDKGAILDLREIKLVPVNRASGKHK